MSRAITPVGLLWHTEKVSDPLSASVVQAISSVNLKSAGTKVSPFET